MSLILVMSLAACGSNQQSGTTTVGTVKQESTSAAGTDRETSDRKTAASEPAEQGIRTRLERAQRAFISAEAFSQWRGLNTKEQMQYALLKKEKRNLVTGRIDYGKEPDVIAFWGIRW